MNARPRPRWKKDLRAILAASVFILPNLLGFLAFSLIPLAFSLVMAFTDWNLQMHNVFQDNPISFVGFDNFIRLFQDRDFFTFLGNTLYLMLGIPFGIAGSLAAALLLNHDFKRGGGPLLGILIATLLLTVGCCALALAGMGKSALTVLILSLFGAIMAGGAFGGQTIYRTLFYFPSFTAGVATFILWKKMYNPETGPINAFLQPILDLLTPLARLFSTTTAFWAASICCGIFFLCYALCVRRIIRRWRDAELGVASFWIAFAILSIPVVCMRFYAPVSWARDWLPAILGGAFLVALIVCLRGRKYDSPKDYGISEATIINGAFMIGLFALIGLCNVFADLPASAEEGLQAPKWLSDYYWAKPAIILMGLWSALGSSNMLLYLAGLSGISKELYEAAEIDGANGWQKFWYVTWPQLSNVTFLIFTMSIIGGLQGGFETAKVMTGGGPAGSTTTLSYYIYTEGFDTGNLGYASAVSWTLFGIVFLVTLFNWKFGNRRAND